MQAGKVTICDLVNTAAAGAMPVEKLSTVTAALFEERAVGYNRFYAAQGVNQQIDLLIRVWRMSVQIGQYAVLEMSENNGQYRITNVQNLMNDDGLKVTDLTLSRLDSNYDVVEEAGNNGSTDNESSHNSTVET